MKVFIDNNLWDYLTKHNVVLEEYFPQQDFQLCVTKHGRYEVLQMPERCEAIKEYASKAMAKIVEEDSYFGFRNDSSLMNISVYQGLTLVGTFLMKREN